MHTWVTLPGPVQLQSMPLQRGTGDRCSRAHRRPTHPTAGESFSTRTSASCPEIGAGDKRRASAASEARAACAAAQRGRREEEVARAPLCSPPRPPGRNGRWIRPAIGFSKRTASTGVHGPWAEEKERSPGLMPRVHGQSTLHAGKRACGAGRARHTVGVVGGVDRSCRTTRPPLQRPAPTRWLVHALHLGLTESRLPAGLVPRESSMLVN